MGKDWWSCSVRFTFAFDLKSLMFVVLVKQKGKKKYFIATQDKDIRQAVGNLAGVPTLYFNKVTLVLESPSEASKNFNNQVAEIHFQLTPIFTVGCRLKNINHLLYSQLN